jgi:hypothetical protein
VATTKDIFDPAMNFLNKVAANAKEKNSFKNYFMMNVNGEVITVSILVEWATAREIIPFSVYREEEQYRAVPMIVEAQRKKAGLPEVICFDFIDHYIVPEKSRSEKTLDVIKSLLRELMVQELIY